MIDIMDKWRYTKNDGVKSPMDKLSSGGGRERRDALKRAWGRTTISI